MKDKIKKGSIVVRKRYNTKIKGKVISVDGDTAMVKWDGQGGTREGIPITLPKKLKQLTLIK